MKLNPFSLLVAVSLSLASINGQVAIGFDGDVAAPRIISIDVSPASVDVTNADAKVTVTFQVMDESGIRDQGPMTLVRLPSNIDRTQLNQSPIRTSGDSKNGYWTTTYTIAKGSLPGSWSVMSFPWSDTLNNSGSFSETKYFTVINSGTSPTPTPTSKKGWITVNLYELVSNAEIGKSGLDICGFRFSSGRLGVNQSVTCESSFSVDLGQFFASSGGLVLKDFKLCGTSISAGATIGMGVNLGCSSPADKAAAELKATQEAEIKIVADKIASEKAAGEKIIADAKAEAARILAAAKGKAAASKKTTITCVKGKITKKVTAVKPVCPMGYKKK